MDSPQPGPSGLSSHKTANVAQESSDSELSDTKSDSVQPKFEPETETSESQSPNKTETDDAKDQEQEKNIFSCTLCNLTECYDFYGTEPPFSKHILLKEKCYVMEDPFVPSGQGEVLILGADCVECERIVCKDVMCSFYYNGTYCLKCLDSERLKEFPAKVREKFAKVREQNLHKIGENAEHDYYDLKNIKESGEMLEGNA